MNRFFFSFLLFNKLFILFYKMFITISKWKCNKLINVYVGVGRCRQSCPKLLDLSFLHFIYFFVNLYDINNGNLQTVDTSFCLSSLRIFNFKQKFIANFHLSRHLNCCINKMIYIHILLQKTKCISFLFLYFSLCSNSNAKLNVVHHL